MSKKLMIGFVSFVAALSLSACAGDTNEKESQNETTQEETNENTEESANTVHSDHSAMNHAGDGQIPEGLKEATNPTFPVGSTAVIQADHMEGMNGAEATIVGAYDTTVYTISYTPTIGSEPVTNHKWVIHEELSGVREEPLEPGAEAMVNADHMKGMEEATATIDSAEQTTVYMVDYTSTSGDEVTNHKWVTESELSAE